MRLICPNCGAQYEVPADAIPPEGRDVQCSNCAHTWMERPGGPGMPDDDPLLDGPDEADDAWDHDAEADEPPLDQPEAAANGGEDGDDEGAGDAGEDALVAAAGEGSGTPATDDPDDGFGTPAEEPTRDAATLSAIAALVNATDDDDARDPAAAAQTPAAEANARTPVRQPLSPTVSSILREEAAREEAARRLESAAAVEVQPDLDLDRPVDRGEQLAEETRRRMARLKGQQAPATSAPVTRTSGARSELLPDIEEISSSLRSSADRAATETPEPDASDKQGRRGFRFGFTLVVLVFGGLALVYAFAPQISAAAPQAEPGLSRYVDAVDRGRLWLDGQMQVLIAAMQTDATD